MSENLGSFWYVCFSAYTEALSKASTEAEKSHVYAALAMVQYKFGDLDDTKSTLFKG